MRVFVTGASGFVGSAIVKELLQAGHTVLGLARAGKSAEKVIASGAELLEGDVNNHGIIQQGAEACDAVIHTAFNHDFSKFKQNCEDDRQVILALGRAGAGKPIVVTSGVGLLSYGRLVTEDDVPPGSDIMPRAASEEAANSVGAYIVRLPPTVHGPGDHGFIAMITNLAKEKGESAYIGEGQNLWPAVNRLDAAVVYRLIIEKQAAQKVYHAVAEEGIAFKQIAEAIGHGLGLPTVSKEGEAADAHFGWFRHFASMGSPSSSTQTRETLGWQPVHAGLMEDLTAGYYF